MSRAIGTGPKGRFGALFCLVAAACVASFPTAQAQPAISRIGVLTLGVAPTSPATEALRQGLRGFGYVEGRNVAFEYRFAHGSTDALPALADELVKLRVDVLVTESTAAALSAKRATRAIPIVMATTSLDPVKTGLAASMSRPGGNVTGLLLFGAQLDVKRLQIFRDTAPKRRVLAVLVNAASPNTPERIVQTRIAAENLNLRLHFIEVRTPEDLDTAFSAVARLKPDGFTAIADGMLFGQRARIADFVSRNRLPAIFQEREFAELGALMSYGTNVNANFSRAAVYVHKILKGAKPDELPIEEPAKIDFVVNLKAAKLLGITVPTRILAGADDVIR